MSKLENTWWPEKYRPKTLDEYVGNDDFIEKVKGWIEADDVPNLILYSEKSGTGKTSACKLIAKMLDADVTYINASDENSIDTVRDKVKRIAATASFKRWKIIILDEFSGFGRQAQSALNAVIEEKSANTRFFLTGNYIDKFLPSIISRCHPFLIQSPPPLKILENLCRILDIEKVQYDKKDLVNIIKKYYPDQRAMLQYCYINSRKGALIYNNDNMTTNDYCSAILEELKNIDRPADVIFKNIRQIIADAKVRDFTELFRYLFDNMNDFVPNGKRSGVIIQLAEHQFRSNQVVDQEIQVMAMIINILMEIKE